MTITTSTYKDIRIRTVKKDAPELRDSFFIKPIYLYPIRFQTYFFVLSLLSRDVGVLSSYI